MTGTVRFIRPSAVQIAEYWDWDRAFPVTPVPAGLGFDAALGDAFRDSVRSLLTQAAGGENAQLQLDPVAAAFGLPAGYDATWRLVQCLENHDLTYFGHDGAARVPMLADPADRQSWYARSRSRAAAALLFAAPGIPALVHGPGVSRGSALVRRRKGPSGSSDRVGWARHKQRDGRPPSLHARSDRVEAWAAGSCRRKACASRASTITTG